MGFSKIIIKQRQKEAEALKIFIFYSLIASFILHIVILYLAINKFLFQTPKVKEELIEVIILETIPQVAKQPKVQVKSPAKITSSSVNNAGEISAPPQTAINKTKLSITPIIKQPQPKTTNDFITKSPQRLIIPEPAIRPNPVKNNLIKNIIPEPAIRPNPVKNNLIKNIIPEPAIRPNPVKNNPIKNIIPEPAIRPNSVKNNLIQKLNENTNTLVSTEPQPDTKLSDSQPSKSETQPNVSSSNTPISPRASTQSPQNRNILGDLGDRSDRQQQPSKNSSRKNPGIENGTGNQKTPENTLIATPPKPPTEKSSELNRAECMKCPIRYPDRAKRRGIEGTSKVAIDTDTQGNVIQVRLISSSGDSELDEAAQQAVREWKLTPTEAGRQGVRASIKFAIK
jgi:TonB family protein